MIYRVLTRKTPYEPKPRSGRPRVTNIRSDRRIQRMTPSQKMSVREITRVLSMNTIHRQIIESDYKIHANMARRLSLSKFYISKRLQWARNHMSYGNKWIAVLFSEDKNGTSELTGIYNIGMIYEKSPGAFSVGKVVVDL
ncbi:hypothetical protein AVEN_26219-1 [Araneus ventricosus]|uniref:Transposase Tc1-like domain-containing protein n=1 Tax=Araneus ventricosus TaxID=182803 RepID=A0A4Y2ANC5_ARAVE|nr:hypothetical protein AVEN_26219-1 [Araneus ventricosus]